MTTEELITAIRNKVEGQFSVFLNLSNASQEYGYHKALEFVLSVLSDIEKSEKPVPNDLEEAAGEYANKRAGNDDWGCYRDGFKAGAKWQKEQMLEEAVEGEIITDNRGNNVVRAGVFNKNFEYGDKVLVIIVKEDEK